VNPRINRKEPSGSSDSASMNCAISLPMNRMLRPGSLSVDMGELPVG
jgi:hypothetical protein